MNCQDFENNVSDLAREQVMEASARAYVLAHRDECKSCARRFEDESALSFRLRVLAADVEAAEVPPLGDELLSAFRTHQLTASRPAATYQSWYWMAAAAAMVLAIIAITILRLHSSTPVAQHSANPLNTVGLQSTPVPQNNIAKGPVTVAGSKAEVSPHKHATSHSRSVTVRNPRRELSAVVRPKSRATGANRMAATTGTAPIVATNSSKIEIATNFIPVGYASATNLQDGGQVVRVELPRSALVAFGLPMNVNRYYEKVKADVFFGADGTARAIRFVQ